MEKHNLKTKKSSNTTTAVGMGLSFGYMIGILFLGGNIAVGLLSGAAIGLLVGMMTDQLGHIPVYTLTGITEGAIAGTVLGLGAGLFHQITSFTSGQSVGLSLLGRPFEFSYIGLGLLICAGLGMLVGAFRETRYLKTSLTAGD